MSDERRGGAGDGQGFEGRAEAFGREVERRAEAFGAEAEAAGRRLAKDPAVMEFADIWGRFWGLLLLGFGLWFLADVTLEMDLPAIAWDRIWPVLLIALGALVVLRGIGRRR